MLKAKRRHRKSERSKRLRQQRNRGVGPDLNPALLIHNEADRPATKIIKFCPMRYHLATTKTLQLGTLSYYKKHDNTFIKDSTEGESTTEVPHSEAIEYSTAELSTLPVAVTFRGSGTLRMMPGSRLVVRQQFPNVYLFCAAAMDRSAEPDFDAARAFGFEGYDSFYEISDPDRFAEIIRGVLARELGHTIIAVHGRVMYDDEKAETFHSLGALVGQLAQRHFWWPLFVKRRVSSDSPEVMFEINREYRFAFIPVDEHGNVVAVDTEPKRIDAEPLRTVAD